MPPGGDELWLVGIGSSAGGVGAMRRLVAALPTTERVAVVVLQHHAESGSLSAVLSPLTGLRIIEAEDGTVLSGGHIYILPHHMNATVANGAIAVQALGETHAPIDRLFTSLGDEYGAHAIGVVLSGTGDDGAAGLRAIRAAGGVTVAQDPSTAEHDEMPRAAIASGVVDIVLPPDQIGSQVLELQRTSHGDPMDRVLAVLREVSQIDFSTYKRATIERRLERQVSKRGLRNLDEYASFLESHHGEAMSAYEDLLVHVTEFFRDAELFDLVITQALPELLDAKAPDAPLRAWVAGCSTGQEAYSLAIGLLEVLAARGDTRELQIFGSDLSERAVDVARQGKYPAAIAEQMSAERLARYFVRDGTGFRVSPRVRERCVFVRHDLVSDPPFSRLDLVSCRNVLIYLGPRLQQRVLPILHYALEQPGFLVLGSSETVGAHEDLFSRFAPGVPVYRRRPVPARPVTVFADRSPIAAARRGLDIAPDPIRDADRTLLARYAPPCVLVDNEFDVVQFRGRTGAYLEPAPGQPQLNVFPMLRERLGPEVRSAALRAQRDDLAVRVEDIQIGEDGTSRGIDVEVIPLRNSSSPRHYLIAFEERPAVIAATRQRIARGTTDRVQQLEQELAASREYLSTVIAQHVSTGEELTALNEELQSANEELQSSNEELRVAKEEIQSTNDELANVNSELERRNAELHENHDDLVNILASVDVAIIIVDASLAIRRFTPRAVILLNLIDSDIGRPIMDLKPRFPIDDLEQVISNVIATLDVHEREVQVGADQHYRMNVRPYRAGGHVVSGAVISFVDVTHLRRSIAATDRAHRVERDAQSALTREKDAFLDAVSHELRTPLSAILLWTEVLRRVESSDPSLLRAVETIESSARAEVQLVDDLLDLALSRADRNRLLVDNRSIAARPIIEATVDALRPGFTAKQVELVTELATDTQVLADPKRLRQIASHLLTNALKFTPAGGTTKVVLARRADQIELAVRDTGRGVNPAYLARVFEPFTQQDTSSTREYPGLGVGLAFVAHLVERLGGTIHVDSEGEGRGSAFVVRLPAST